MLRRCFDSPVMRVVVVDDENFVRARGDASTRDRAVLGSSSRTVTRAISAVRLWLPTAVVWYNIYPCPNFLLLY